MAVTKSRTPPLGIKVTLLTLSVLANDLLTSLWSSLSLPTKASLLLLLVAKAERMLALLNKPRLLVLFLSPADRALLLFLLLTSAEGHLVALAAATPVVGAGCRLVAVVRRSVYILRQASVRGAVVGNDVASACDRVSTGASRANRIWAHAHRRGQWCSSAA